MKKTEKTISTAQSFIETKALVNWVLRNFSGINKSYKYLLGEPCMKEVTSMLSLISNAIITSNKESRLDYLDRYMASLNTVNAFIDILVEDKQLSPKKEAEFSLIKDSLGKQINNWRKLIQTELS